jgi:hypothetical protein
MIELVAAAARASAPSAAPPNPATTNIVATKLPSATFVRLLATCTDGMCAVSSITARPDRVAEIGHGETELEKESPK